jgi:hypothetical protein
MTLLLQQISPSWSGWDRGTMHMPGKQGPSFYQSTELGEALRVHDGFCMTRERIHTETTGFCSTGVDTLCPQLIQDWCRSAVHVITVTVTDTTCRMYVSHSATVQLWVILTLNGVEYVL